MRCRGERGTGDTTEVLRRRAGPLSAAVEIPAPSPYEADGAKGKPTAAPQGSPEQRSAT